MKLISLTNKKECVSFEEALWSGLAANGGLYYPDQIIPFTERELSGFSDQSFQAVALAVLSHWLDGEIPTSDLEQIVCEAFNFDVPLVNVGPFKVLELFHGPTMAFKDVAARFLAQCFEYYARKRNRPVNIIVATSGDTGGAIADAFSGLADVKVFILFPKGRVSKLQHEQLTKDIHNVEPLEIEGSFDDCQKLVKHALGDSSLSVSLTSANSINIGRLLPQSTYYAYAGSLIGLYEAVIPTGNLGNATAALLAHQLHSGPAHITLANNANDALLRYHQSGTYAPRISIKTLSNAMDVGNPNNFTRFVEPFGGDVEKLRKYVDVFSVGDEETVSAIKRVYEKYGYLLDPHTAVAWRAAELSQSTLPKVVVSTASPAKFAKEIAVETGIELSRVAQVPNSSKQTSKSTPISNEYKDLKNFLVQNCLT